MVKKKDSSREQQDSKTGFYGSGMKTATPGRHNPSLVETADMPVVEEVNTIRYNDPETPFQMLLLNLFRSSVAKLNAQSSSIGTPTLIGSALAELIKAADPEARSIFLTNYNAAFEHPDALYTASVDLEPRLVETFDLLEARKMKKRVVANKNRFSYGTSFKGNDVEFHVNFQSLTEEDKTKNIYNQVVGHFQKMRQVAGGSLGGVGRAYDIVHLEPASEGGWLKKAKTIPALDAIVKDPKGYYDAGGVFLLSDIIHVEERLRPEDAIKAVAAVNNNYERRNWILTELLSLPERLKKEYS